MNRTEELTSLHRPQLCLPFEADPHRIADRLTEMTGVAIDLTVTDNAVSMLSASRKNGRVSLRMHRQFLQAGDDILQAVAGFATGRRGCRKIITAFIREQVPISEKRRSCRTLRPSGAVHGLSDIFTRLNREYFGSRITAGITWGNNRARRSGRRITLGTYCRTSNIIRINPLLDRPKVPAYFVEHIVYHEMLHADLMAGSDGRRVRHHSALFCSREKEFIHHEKALAWEKTHL